ncbi:MAG TPA: threonine/serine exporter family protein [Bacillales bacterium]|nr:threonine/serine exporter family protein [Bacillales bacterium]
MNLTMFITGFIASAGFGFLFNVPRRAVFAGGIAGMTGWVIYDVLLSVVQLNIVVSTAAAAFAIAVLSQLFARVYKMPVIIFSAAGIIPLVPGGVAYNTMRRFVSNDYYAAVELAAQVFLISGAIAFGLVLANVFQPLFKPKHEAERRE